MEEGAVMMVGFNWNLIENALKIILDQGRGEERKLRIVKDYEVQNVSEKIIRIIFSYIYYVRTKVWKE